MNSIEKRMGKLIEVLFLIFLGSYASASAKRIQSCKLEHFMATNKYFNA